MSIPVQILLNIVGLLASLYILNFATKRHQAYREMLQGLSIGLILSNGGFLIVNIYRILSQL